MIKAEFDNASRAAGFGECADYMWPEIERCYSTSDRIDRVLMVDIYWHEPGIYREILALRYAIGDAAKSLAFLTEFGSGYRFAVSIERFHEVAMLYTRLNDVITEAENRKAARGCAVRRATATRIGAASRRASTVAP